MAMPPEDGGASEPDKSGPALKGFGTGGLTFFVAQSRTLWTLRSSFVIAFVGLAGIGLGIWDGNAGLAALFGVVFVVAAAWLAGSWRSQRDAHRLENRVRRPGSLM